MSDNEINTARLVEPSESLREAYLDFLEEFERAGETEIPGAGPFKGASVESFAALLRRERETARGINLPEGYVPGSTYWLACAGRVIGTCNLRHSLSESLRACGGHIGYSIRPSERNKGCGTLVLRLALGKARELGSEKVLVSCDKDNIASARVIQKNGGVLESEGIDPSDGKAIQRYWINLRPSIRGGNHEPG